MVKTTDFHVGNPNLIADDTHKSLVISTAPIVERRSQFTDGHVQDLKLGKARH